MRNGASRSIDCSRRSIMKVARQTTTHAPAHAYADANPIIDPGVLQSSLRAKERRRSGLKAGVSSSARGASDYLRARMRNCRDRQRGVTERGQIKTIERGCAILPAPNHHPPAQATPGCTASTSVLLGRDGDRAAGQRNKNRISGSLGRGRGEGGGSDGSD